MPELRLITPAVQRGQGRQQGADHDLGQHHRPARQSEGDAVERDLLGRGVETQEQHFGSVPHHGVEQRDDRQRQQVRAQLAEHGRGKRGRALGVEGERPLALEHAGDGGAEHAGHDDAEDVAAERDGHGGGQELQRHLDRRDPCREVVALRAIGAVRINRFERAGEQRGEEDE